MVKVENGSLVMHPYIVRPLDAQQVALAFPLVRVLDPHLTLDSWSSYARLFVEASPDFDKRVIITVQSQQGYIHGLAACCLKPVLHGSRILEVENFVCLDLTGGRRAITTLLRATEAYARNWNCSYIRLSLLEPRLEEGPPDRNRTAIDLLEAAGYREESAQFGKSFLALG